MMNQTATILLTCVCYHDAETVLRFLRHTLEQVTLPAHYRLHIALADNSGSLTTAEVPAHVSVYQSGENLGYLGGCAYAYRRWYEEHQYLPAWTGVVNTDIEFAAQFFLRLSELTLPENTGIIAPDIRLPDGTRQNPFMRVRPSRGRMLHYIISRRLFLALPVLKSAHRAAFLAKRSLLSRRTAARTSAAVDAPPEVIYAPHGSAIFLHRRFFAAGGSLEYDSFLYMEEIHLAEQARRAGLVTAWAPALRIAHCENTTTGKINQVRRLRWEYQSAKVIYQSYFSE